MARSEEAIHRRASKRNRTEGQQRQADRNDMDRHRIKPQQSSPQQQQQSRQPPILRTTTPKSVHPPSPTPTPKSTPTTTTTPIPQQKEQNEQQSPNKPTNDNNNENPMNEIGAWKCTGCGNENYASRHECHSKMCNEVRPRTNTTGTTNTTTHQYPRQQRPERNHSNSHSSSRPTSRSNSRPRRPTRHDEATSKKQIWSKQADYETLSNNLELRQRYRETMKRIADGDTDGAEEEEGATAKMMTPDEMERAKTLIERDERKKLKKEIKEQKRQLRILTTTTTTPAKNGHGRTREVMGNGGTPWLAASLSKEVRMHASSSSGGGVDDGDDGRLESIGTTTVAIEDSIEADESRDIDDVDISPPGEEETEVENESKHKKHKTKRKSIDDDATTDVDVDVDIDTPPREKQEEEDKDEEESKRKQKKRDKKERKEHKKQKKEHKKQKRNNKKETTAVIGNDETEDGGEDTKLLASLSSSAPLSSSKEKVETDEEVAPKCDTDTTSTHDVDDEQSRTQRDNNKKTKSSKASSKKQSKSKYSKLRRDRSKALRKQYLETKGKGMKEELVERAKFLIEREEEKKQEQQQTIGKQFVKAATFIDIVTV